MRTRTLSLAALCLCLTGASLRPASADATADARKAIEANYAKMAAALNKKDADGYTQFYTDDYVKISKDGQKKNKAQATADLKAALQQMKTAKFAIKVVKFALQQGKATANAQLNLAMSAPNPSTGKISQVTVNAVNEFIWVHSGTAWKIKQSKDMSSKMTVDGKPVGATKQ